MNKLLTSISRRPLAHVASATLIVFGAALAVSAVMAQSSNNTKTKKGECADWPSIQDQPKVEAAFDKALNDSAMDTPEGRKFRKQLLDPSDCYKQPKAAVQHILKTMYPNDHIVFRPEAVVIFYENDSPDLKGSQRPFADYPSDHCLHIFYLPEVGGQGAAKASFRENLMCCYKPWIQAR